MDPEAAARAHDTRRPVWKSNLQRVRIDATPARWRGDVGSSPCAPDTLVDFHTGGDTQKLVRELSRSCSLGSELSISGRSGRDRFRAAARAVIAAKRLSTVDSDPSRSKDD